MEADPEDCALFFWVVWTSERYWDRNPDHCRLLSNIFNELVWHANATMDAAVVELVNRVRDACPHLPEVLHSIEKWVSYELPGD